MPDYNKAAELAEKLYHAAINCPHEIDSNSVVLHFDSKQPGHNALNQLNRRLEAAALLRASEGRVPEGWRLARTHEGIEVHQPGGTSVYVEKEALGEHRITGEVLWALADALLTSAPHPPAQQAEPDVLPAPDEKKLCAAIAEHILSSDAAGIPAVSRQDFRAGVDFARRYYASQSPCKADEADECRERRRLPEEKARAIIEAWLKVHAPGFPDYSLCEDGDDGWAFWMAPHDTTSYVHWNGKVEWYGTGWPELYANRDDGEWVDANDDSESVAPLTVIDPNDWEPCTPEFILNGGVCDARARLWNPVTCNHWHPKRESPPPHKAEGAQ